MSQILEQLIYRANIFNYDNKFLDERANLKLEVTNSPKQDEIIAEFTKDSAEDQLRNIQSLRKEDRRDVEKENPMNQAQNDPKQEEKTRTFLKNIFELISGLQTKISDNQTKCNNSLLYCLLYLDGLIMMDIEVVRVFADGLHQKTVNLVKELKSILSCKYNEDAAKEVASHILSAYYAFNNPETIEAQEWFYLIKWTADFSVTRYICFNKAQRIMFLHQI